MTRGIDSTDEDDMTSGGVGDIELARRVENSGGVGENSGGVGNIELARRASKSSSESDSS